MLVKKTKAGKYSLLLRWHERDGIWGALANFLETESVKLMGLKGKSETEVMRNLYYAVHNELMLNKDWHLHENADKRILVSPAEAIALMWMLRNYDSDIILLRIKSDLHKLLS
jgi:hypothetical protein